MSRLHVVTDARVLSRADWPHLAAQVLAAGGEGLTLHVRGGGLSGRVIHDRVEALMNVARAAGAALVVNDRVDVALALPLDGVQLGEESLPAREARALLGAELWVGASVHGPERATDAAREGADFLVLGTIFESRSHPGRPGDGPDLVARVSGLSELPVLAIGGVTPGRVAAVVAAGAYGVAVLGGVWDAPDPARAVQDYLRAIGEAGVP